MDKGEFDAAYIAQPSFVEKIELEAIARPLAIAAAEKDLLFDADKRQESENILELSGQPYQINLYQGVEHGWVKPTLPPLHIIPTQKFCARNGWSYYYMHRFAICENTSSRAVQYAKENAFVLALQWFEEHLKDHPDLGGFGEASD